MHCVVLFRNTEMMPKRVKRHNMLAPHKPDTVTMRRCLQKRIWLDLSFVLTLEVSTSVLKDATVKYACAPDLSSAAIQEADKFLSGTLSPAVED